MSKKMDSEEITTHDRQEQAFAELLGRALPAPELQPLPPGLSERIAATTYARPSLWAKLALVLQPAPVRFALGGAVTAAALCAVILPRLPQPAKENPNNGLPVAAHNPSPATPAPNPQTPVDPSPAPVVDAAPRSTLTAPKPPSATPLPPKAPATPIKAPSIVVAYQPTPAPHKPVVTASAEHVSSGLVLRPEPTLTARPDEGTKGQVTSVSSGASGTISGRVMAKAEADPVPTPSPTMPSTTTTVARLPRTETALASDEEEKPFKVSLAVTNEQMKDASKIDQLRGAQQPNATRGTNLDVISAPVK